MARWVRISVAILLLGAFVACSGGDDDSGGAGGGISQKAPLRERTGVQAEAFDLGAPESTGGGSSVAGGASSGSTAVSLPDVGPSVIKNASVELSVKEALIDDAMRDATLLAGRYGGFVLSSGTSTNPRTGHLVIRVPSSSFERALSELKEFGRVRNEKISGQDVSLEFVDLEARLRNLTAQETVMLRLMERSQSIADTIRVQRELEGIQLSIERIRGRLRFLDDQTSFGTIAASFTEIGAVPVRTPILTRAWERATEAFLNVVGAAVVVAGSLLPFLVLVAVGLLIFRRVLPKGRLTRGEV